jgi:hypothetical protein
VLCVQMWSIGQDAVMTCVPSLVTNSGCQGGLDVRSTSKLLRLFKYALSTTEFITK